MLWVEAKAGEIADDSVTVVVGLARGHHGMSTGYMPRPADSGHSPGRIAAISEVLEGMIGLVEMEIWLPIGGLPPPLR